MSILYKSFCKVAVLVFLNDLQSVITEDANNFDSCDMTGNHNKFREGILGEVGEFPWLGVLRVPIREPGQPLVVAATGVVLVTVKHVIANADDISKTSQTRLMQQGSIHFVPEGNKTWSSKLKNLVIHPEYEYATLNTLALVELDQDIEYEDQHYRAVIKPACWPGVGFNATNTLYVTGYTDERMLLEKVLHKSQYVNKSLCNEFYKRNYLLTGNLEEPKNYVCTSAVNKTKGCQWDNGMALVSNFTGHWTIVGFGVASPGCLAPTRFLEMAAYIDWIQTSSRDPMNYDYYGGRQIDVAY